MQDSDWTKCCPSYLVVVKDVCSPGITRVPGVYGNHPPRGRITIAAQHICIKLGGKREEEGEKGRKRCTYGEGGEGAVSVVCKDQVYVEACEWIVPRP